MLIMIQCTSNKVYYENVEIHKTFVVLLCFELRRTDKKNVHKYFLDVM